MTNENKNEPLQKSEETQQDTPTDVLSNENNGEPESDENILDLTDDREYPNQINMLREISHIYQHLTPSNKKIVRLSIARTA